MGKPHHNLEVWKRSLDFVSQSQTEPLLKELEEISRMITGLQKSLRLSK